MVSCLGIPAVYVPLPIGNGEQSKNAAGVVEAGGAIAVKNADFTGEWIQESLVPLLRDAARIAEMAAKTATQGMRDGTAKTVALIAEALTEAKANANDQD